jgi:hypothetical protein
VTPGSVIAPTLGDFLQQMFLLRWANSAVFFGWAVCARVSGPGRLSVRPWRGVSAVVAGRSGDLLASFNNVDRVYG